MNTGASEPDEEGFVWQTEQFSDLKLLDIRSQDGEQLNQRQQALVYCLNMAGLSGRDIMYDQNNRYNLTNSQNVGKHHTSYDGDKSTKGWDRFETYLKRIWFSNGIHHHYSNKKHFLSLVKNISITC